MSQIVVRIYKEMSEMEYVTCKILGNSTVKEPGWASIAS